MFWNILFGQTAQNYNIQKTSLGSQNGHFTAESPGALLISCTTFWKKNIQRCLI